MTWVEEAQLAWDLVNSVGVLLHGDSRLVVWAKIGAGEYKSTIVDLLGYCVWYEIELPSYVVARILEWVEGFRASDRALPLRHMVAGLRQAGRPHFDSLKWSPAVIFEFDTQFLSDW